MLIATYKINYGSNNDWVALELKSFEYIFNQGSINQNVQFQTDTFASSREKGSKLQTDNNVYWL